MQLLPPESYGILVILIMPPLLYVYKRFGWVSRPWRALEVTGMLAIALVLLQSVVQWLYIVSVSYRALLHSFVAIPITAAAALWLSLMPGFLLDLRRSPWLPDASRRYLAAALVVPLLFLEVSVLTVLSLFSWAMTLVQTGVVSLAITLAVRSEWRSSAPKTLPGPGGMKAAESKSI